MKDIILLRDNEEGNYIYGALLVDKDKAEDIKEKINIIMEFFYNHVANTNYSGNTYDYVLGVLSIMEFEFEVINETHDAKI